MVKTTSQTVICHKSVSFLVFTSIFLYKNLIHAHISQVKKAYQTKTTRRDKNKIPLALKVENHDSESKIS